MTLQQQILTRVAPGYAKRVDDLERELAEARNNARVLRDSLLTFADTIQEYRPALTSPQRTVAALQEQGYDSGMVQLLVDQLGWDSLASLSTVQDDYRQERDTMVEQAIRLFRYSPLAQWAIWLWTGWGLGDAITVTFDNSEDAQKTWDEFVGAERNEPVMGADTLHELSDWLLVKGNRFIALFTSKMGDNRGKTTARILDQDEVTFVCNPEDKTDVWFYRREMSTNAGGSALYYPDYKTFTGDGGLLEKRWNILTEKRIVASSAKRADKAQTGTAVCVYHVAYNRKEETSPWGWPITTTSGAWVRGHKQFSEARLGVAMAVAQFVRRTQVKGGSRAVSSVLGQVQSTLTQSNYLDTNPPGAAGSWHVENQASDTKELPMRTGASDAKEDNAIFSWMALLGMGIFPTSAGLDTSRWATAVEMDKAQAMLFERYQRFWSAQFRRLSRLVLVLADRYNDALRFTEKDLVADVSTDTFSLSDYPAVSNAVANQVDKMLRPFVELGVIPDQTAKKLLAKLWGLSLDALGSDFAGDLTTEEAFGAGKEPMPEPPSPPVAPEEEPEPGMESDFLRTLGMTLQSLDAGDITADQWAEMMVAEIGDVHRERNGNGGA